MLEREVRGEGLCAGKRGEGEGGEGGGLNTTGQGARRRGGGGGGGPDHSFTFLLHFYFRRWKKKAIEQKRKGAKGERKRLSRVNDRGKRRIEEVRTEKVQLRLLRISFGMRTFEKEFKIR